MSSFFFAMNRLRALFTSSQKKKLEAGLSQTKQSFFAKLGTALVGKSKVDDDLLDELEEVLIRADVGGATTLKIIEALEKEWPKTSSWALMPWGKLCRKKSPIYWRIPTQSNPKIFLLPYLINRK